MRILVTGSRDWDDDRLIAQRLDYYSYRADRLVVVHGGCRTGADWHAECWTRNAYNASAEVHPADWRPHGIYNPQAGLVRNRKMVELGADVCLAFIRNGSRGASHCAHLAEEAGVPTRRFTA